MPALNYAFPLEEEPSTPGRAQRGFWRGLNWLLTVALVATFVAIGYCGLEQIRPTISRSDSMRPHSKAGDLILTRYVPVNTVEPGDIVTFIDSTRHGDQTTHRLVSKRPVKVGDLVIAYDMVTKGDANQGPDKQWRIDANGKVGNEVVVIPNGGRVANWLSSPIGRGTIGALILFILAASWMTGRQRRSVQ